MIKVLLLDIDGVLIDDTKLFYHKIHKHYNLTKEEFMEFYNSDYKKTWVNEIDLKESLQKWIKKWELETTVEEFLETWLKSEDRPNLNLIEFIKNKKIKNVFLATTQEKYRLNYILKNMQFNEFTKEAFPSYLFKTKKPEIQFYKNVFERLKKYFPDLKSEEILFFDDSISNVKGAIEFGFQSFQYTSFEDCKKIIEEYNL